MKSLNRQSGFFLISALAALVVVSIVAIYSLRNVESSTRNAYRSAYAAESAWRFKVYYNGIASYLTTNRDTIPENNRHAMQVNTMMTNGDLPQDFAECPSGAFGCSPWGSVMRAFGIKDEDDVFRSVIVWRTGFNAGEAERTGLDVSAQGLPLTSRAIAKEVAKLAEREHGLVAGVIPANSLVVEGVNGRFSMDISAYENTLRDFDRPVVFYGWPELGQTDPSDNNTNTGSFGPNSECQVDFATYTAGSGWYSGSCSAGWDEEAVVQACYSPAQYGYVISIGRDGSTMTVGGFGEEKPSNRDPDGSCIWNCDSGYQDRWTYGTLSLNSSRVWTGVCELRYYDDFSGTQPPTIRYGPPFPPSSITHSYCCRDLN